MKYKKLRHHERPFMLHIFIDYPTELIAEKINAVKSRTRIKSIEFESDHFELQNDDDACVFPLEDVLPAHFALVLRHNPSPGTISHEVFHLVARHFRYIGTPLTEENEEPYAYMMSWITDEIHKLYV